MKSETTMPIANGWDDAIRWHIQVTRSRLLSLEEFSRALSEVIAHPFSPVAAVQFEISRPSPHELISVGDTGIGVETASFPVDNFDPKATCRIRTWSKHLTGGGEAVDFPSVTALLSEWARVFWRGPARDVSGLLWWQNTDIRDPLTSALRIWSTSSPLVATFYADLDHFKAANDRFGQAKGDDVINSFGALLERVTPRSGLVIRQGGDEFLVFLPVSDSTEALQHARAISRSVSDYDFGTGEIRIGVSVGITTGTRFDPDFSAEILATRAEKGVKPGGDSSKLRGQVRFYQPQTPVDPASFTNETRDLAGATAKATLLEPTGLGNPWLDLLASEATRTYQTERPNAGILRRMLDNLLDWIQPDWSLSSTRLGTAGETLSNYSPSFSRWDAALAVAHGVYRAKLPADVSSVAGERLIVQYTADLSSCQLIAEPSGDVLLQIGDSDQFSEEFSLGGFFTVPPHFKERPAGRRPILVHIGYEKPSTLARSLFDSVILVDARPSASGGLPDFWASAVANVITAVHANPNVPAIYIAGDLQYGSETIKKLTELHLGQIDADKIAEKTGLALKTIRCSIPRLEGRVVEVPSTDALYEHAMACLRDAYTFEMPHELHAQPRASLQRPLQMTQLGLTRDDGCRVQTLHEAFPIVLEIARTAEDSPIRDQAARDVRELIDFKVHLMNPSRDLIPEFYRDDSESLEAYFQTQFLDADGLFGKWFAHQNQQSVVVNHIAEVIVAGNQFATRRAVLVIPHHTAGATSPSPLGLISVRIVPRFRDSAVNLTYSYTWRTVEALVGFPYSAYGSVRFSEHLTAQIRSLLPEEQRANVRMKDISYVAHSLHFFVDEHGQQIARKIVNDATL